MVEHRHWTMRLLPHLVLGVGVLIVVFPVYLAFVGATLDPATIANGQMGLVPGDLFFDNMSRVLVSGTGRGIGRAVALELASRGARVFGADLDTAASDAQLATLIRLTERYCVVLQTLAGSPTLRTDATVTRG